MTQQQQIALLDDVAVGLASHGWHVASVRSADGPPTLTVRGRMAGEWAYHVALEGHELRLSGDGDGHADLGVGHDAVELHAMLRADVARRRRGTVSR